MPVNPHTTWTASCDECPWFEDDFETEKYGTQALDEHIEEKH